MYLFRVSHLMMIYVHCTRSLSQINSILYHCAESDAKKKDAAIDANEIVESFDKQCHC